MGGVRVTSKKGQVTRKSESQRQGGVGLGQEGGRHTGVTIQDHGLHKRRLRSRGALASEPGRQKRENEGINKIMCCLASTCVL